MPAADWLTDELIDSVKRRGNISTSTDGWSDSDILAMATDEMRDSIVPMLRRLSEEFLVNDYDQNVVSGTSAYSLPEWALGEALRDVQIADGSGGFFPLPRKEPHDVAAVPAQVRPICYFLRDNKVVLVPTPSASVTSGLRMRCLRRPSKLVSIDRGFRVSGIISDEASYTALGSGTDALIDNQDLDVTAAKPGFRLLLQADAVNNDGAGTATFPATITAFAVGDYITLRDESVVPQIPAELHPLLAQSTVCAFLRASGQPGYELAEAKRQQMEMEAKNLFSPRTENQARYVKNKYGVR